MLTVDAVVIPQISQVWREIWCKYAQGVRKRPPVWLGSYVKGQLWVKACPRNGSPQRQLLGRRQNTP